MAKKIKEALSSGNDRDELSHSLMTAINKNSKEGQVGYFVGTEETPTDLKNPISTGSSLLDLAISNVAHGGIYCSKIYEIASLEGGGKSLLCAHIMANCQKQGGVAILIDTENAMPENYFRAIGLNLDNLGYYTLYTVEEIFEKIEFMITHIRQSNKDRPVVIVVDSLAGASTKAELEGGFSKEGYGTQKPILISMAMRKLTGLIGDQRIAVIFTNQLRHVMNPMIGQDKFTTSGGKSLGFHASCRLRLAIVKKLKNKNDDIIGITVKATVTKNRFCAPYRKCEFDIFFDRGIDDVSSWLRFLKEKTIIKGTGAAHTYVDTDGVEHKFKSSEWASMLAKDEHLKEDIYQKMCDAVITSYVTAGMSPDDIQSDVATEEE